MWRMTFFLVLRKHNQSSYMLTEENSFQVEQIMMHLGVSAPLNGPVLFLAQEELELCIVNI